MSRYPPLPEIKKAEIKSQYGELLNGYEVARRLNVSKTTVYRVLGGMRRCPRWTDEEKSLLTEWYTRGKPPTKIAAKIGRSTQAVKIAMCRHRKKIRSDPDIKRAAFLLQVALSAGLTPGRAIQKIRTCGAFERESDVNDLQF